MTEEHQQITPLRRWLITIAVMSATLMQVLDITIVNVALPHMQGSLGTTPDQISWILTSYLVSSAILMPLTGYFTDRIGRRKFLLISIAGFVVASCLCGASTSLAEIVIFRLLQGVFGAALVPLSQAILVDIYPEKDRGKAMAIWGMGVMVGPILGPTLGGYLTEVATWRWNFYINFPIGIISLYLVWQFMPDSVKKERSMGWLSLALLSTGIGATQYFLDRGNQQDWLSALDIRIALGLAIIGWIGFLLVSFYDRKNIVFDLRIFKDRNFSLCTFLIGLFGIGLFGAMVVIPLMLENLMDYPVLTTGLVMAPRGISSMVSMLVVAKLIQHVDPRKLIAAGVIICAIGTEMGTWYTIQISPGWIMGPLILQGFGIGMMFVPLSALAFATLAPQFRAEAAGIFSLFRTIGSSIGISICITLFTRHAQMSWNHLSGSINPFNPAVNEYLQPLNTTWQDPLGAQLLGLELGRQAQMLAFLDVFAFITWSFVFMLPFVLLLKKAPKANPTDIPVGE